MKVKTDCIYFLGDKPCKYKRLCGGCKEYKKIRKKILILKMASIGDVLRTTPLVRAMKRKYQDCHITWVTRAESTEVLENNAFVDRLLPFTPTTLSRLMVEEFDRVISLDKAGPATSLATIVKAKEKDGFVMNKYGNLEIFNKKAEYNFRLGLDNRLKYNINKKTYQEIIFETAGLKWGKEEYILELSPLQSSCTASFMRRHGLKARDLKIGLNTGCGSTFQGKKWTIEGSAELSDLLQEKLEAKVILLGGPDEKERNKEIASFVEKPLIDAGCDNSLRDFIAIVDACDIVVTTDTLAVHVATALKKRIVAIFGPTCAQEIGLYGRGKKIVSDAKCAPCYKKICDKGEVCMKNISPGTVFKAVKSLI